MDDSPSIFGRVLGGLVILGSCLCIIQNSLTAPAASLSLQISLEGSFPNGSKDFLPFRKIKRRQWQARGFCRHSCSPLWLTLARSLWRLIVKHIQDNEPLVLDLVLIQSSLYSFFKFTCSGCVLSNL